MSHSHQNPLFDSDFKVISPEEWAAEITKNLKNRPLAEIFTLRDGITNNPIAHAPSTIFPPLPTIMPGNAWKIGQTFLRSNSNNEDILQALAGGLQAIRLEIEDPNLHVEALNLLLENVNLDYVDLHLILPCNKQIFEQIHAFFPPNCRGSITWQSDERDKNFEATNTFSTAITTDHPFIQGGVVKSGQTDTVKHLAALIHSAHLRLVHAENAAIEPATAAKSIAFQLPIHDAILHSVALCRALHHLWANLLSAWHIPLMPARLHAEIPALHPPHSEENALLRQSIMAFAATLGQVDTIFIASSDTSARSVRNIQHLLQLESQLDSVADPLSGSYYIEDLTQKIAQAAWKIVQEEPFF